MKAYSLEQKFSAEVIGVFPFPGLDNFIVSVKIHEKKYPKIGYFVTFSNEDLWKVVGIALVAINKKGEEVLSEKQNKGIWDLQLAPVLVSTPKPTLGHVTVSDKLPPTIIKNRN